MATTYFGFLETPFLDEPVGFLGGQAIEHTPFQINIINTKQQNFANQVQVVVEDSVTFANQGNLVITEISSAGAQIQFDVFSSTSSANQTQILNANESHLGAQVQIQHEDGFRNFAVESNIVNTKGRSFGSQVKVLANNGAKKFGAEVNISRPIHYVCPEFLMHPFLSGPFLVSCRNVVPSAQVKIVVSELVSAAQQARSVITNARHFGMQTKIINTKQTHVGAQIQIFGSTSFGSQVRVVIYNSDKLRILADFPSRGTTGLNWTASSTQVGDFSVNNLNTDIVEQYWRSATGDTTNLELVCDTEVAQGVFVDTFAMLGHNLSGSASVFLDASNDAGFATTETVAIALERNENAYWIAPTVPLVSYRYWRLRINDTTNPDGFIRVGTVLFGSAIIFAGECFVDQVRFGNRQFVDVVQTEGFSPVKNDRGQKKNVRLEFRKLRYLRANFTNMRQLFEDKSTLLKCLWVPTPRYPGRYAVFGRLSEIPTETHNDFGLEADYVDFSINVDEAE
jgi:hypothetical protein